MQIRVNWNQRFASDGLIRVHQILDDQPTKCEFDKMKGDIGNFPDVSQAEAALKQKGYSKYKRCKHCWDNTTVDPIM